MHELFLLGEGGVHVPSPSVNYSNSSFCYLFIQPESKI